MRTEREVEIYKELKKRRKLGSGVDEWKINIELAQEFGVGAYNIGKIESKYDSVIAIEKNMVWKAIMQGFVGEKEGIGYNPYMLYKMIKDEFEAKGKGLKEGNLDEFEKFFDSFDCQLDEYGSVIERAKKWLKKAKETQKNMVKQVEKEKKKREVEFSGETIQAYYMVRACELMQAGKAEKEAIDCINKAYDLNQSLHTGKEKKIAELYRAVLD